MIARKIFPAAVIVVVMAGCGGSSTPEPKRPDPRLPQLSFEGLKFPGNATDAKSQGFVDCKEDYSNYTCVRIAPTSLLGVVAEKAYVHLNPGDAFEERYYSSSDKITAADSSKLTYRSIVLEYERFKVDKKCVARKKRPGDLIDPEECEIAGGLNTLEAKLAEAGWMKKWGRRTTEYYREGLPLMIEVSTANDTVSIKPIREKEAQEIWTALQSQQAASDAAAKKSDDFIQSMKK